MYISNTLYQELSVINPPLSHWCALNKISKIDSITVLFQDHCFGVQQSLTQRLKLRVEYLVKSTHV